MNENGHLPRHITANVQSDQRRYLLYVLHRVGAKRCPPDAEGCNEGCSYNGTDNGEPKSQEITTPVQVKKALDDEVTKHSMTSAMIRSDSMASSTSSQDFVSGPLSPAGDRVLSLDGGGIRGLVLTQLLLKLEAVTGRPITELFDWIGGTSTGGILALALSSGKPLRFCIGLYFRLKDIVFQGSRPYDSEPFEQFLRKEFGEHSRMTDIEKTKVLVTGVLGDRNPADLHIFRNYETPGIDHDLLQRHSKYPLPPRPHDQYIWRAARASGAAPTYFRAFGRFLDGGLMANNPTIDILTEMHEYSMGLKAAGRSSEVRPMHVVVSLGTGRLPIKPVDACDVYRPEGLMDVYKNFIGAKNLGELFVEAATQSEGRPVDRAHAWCSMIGVPFFRFSPQLLDHISLDCTDDSQLINMLWETECYINDNMEKFKRLATLLCK